MKYRKLGRTGIELSALGFGAMRLPTRGGVESDVDEAAAIGMIRHAIGQGVNYVDTAYVYHGGNSEVVVGKALAAGDRSRVHVATKLPVWSVNRLQDADRLLAEQLDRLQMDQIDFYLLHCLQKGSWARMQELGMVGWLEKQRAAGRIKHFGFSFHDSYEVFESIVQAYDWSFCQIQYNYVCEEVQAGTKGLELAAAKGLGVIIMEPLFGGTLANPPLPIQSVWNSSACRCQPTDLALRWLWNKPEVSLVLSGMSTLDQVKQNLASASRSGVSSLSREELDLIAQVREAYRKLSPIPCTKCGYCMPCPNGVNIPLNFDLYNQASVLEGNSASLCRNLYLGLPEAERASECIQCGDCETRCPQQIPIIENLAKVPARFR